MAPRWSIILNEHGCQLQVYWRSPSAPEKGILSLSRSTSVCSKRVLLRDIKITPPLVKLSFIAL